MFLPSETYVVLILNYGYSLKNYWQSQEIQLFKTSCILSSALSVSRFSTFSRNNMAFNFLMVMVMLLLVQFKTIIIWTTYEKYECLTQWLELYNMSRSIFEGLASTKSKYLQRFKKKGIGKAIHEIHITRFNIRVQSSFKLKNKKNFFKNKVK